MASPAPVVRKAVPAAPKEVETKIPSTPKALVTATKAAVAPAPAEVETEAEPSKGNRSRFKDEMIITTHLDHNPKRPGTTGHAHFEQYVDGMTCADARAAGVSNADLAWDEKHDFIAVGGEHDPEYEKRSKPVKVVKEKKVKAEAEAEAPATPVVPKTAKAPMPVARTVKGKASAVAVEEEEE